MGDDTLLHTQPGIYLLVMSPDPLALAEGLGHYVHMSNTTRMPMNMRLISCSWVLSIFPVPLLVIDI